MFQLPKFEKDPQWSSQQSRLIIGGWLYPVEVHIRMWFLHIQCIAVLYTRMMDKSMCFIYRCHFKITVMLSCFVLVCFLGLLHGVYDHEHGFISCRIKVLHQGVGLWRDSHRLAYCLNHVLDLYISMSLRLWVFLSCIVMSVDLSAYIFPTTTRCLIPISLLQPFELHKI